MTDAKRFRPDIRRSVAADLASVIHYHGHFTNEIAKSILSESAATLRSVEEHSRISHRVFHVALESVQNILRHGEACSERRESSHLPVFEIRKQMRGYVVTSGNPVSKRAAGELKTKLQRVNDLDQQGLKQLYRHILKSTGPSHGGAGLGFVDMARRSGEKLLFDFQEISDDHCFFKLTVAVNENR